MFMYKSLAIFTGCLIAVNLTACSGQNHSENADMTQSSSNGSGPAKLAWPHARPLSAKEEEDFNTDYTTLEGTLKEFYDGPDESRILINENEVSFRVTGKNFKRFDKSAFVSKIEAKSDSPIKFLIEHLEAEQPHTDPKTGKLFMNVHGVIVGNDNVDLIKSRD